MNSYYRRFPIWHYTSHTNVFARKHRLMWLLVVYAEPAVSHRAPSSGSALHPVSCANRSNAGFLQIAYSTQLARAWRLACIATDSSWSPQVTVPLVITLFFCSLFNVQPAPSIIELLRRASRQVYLQLIFRTKALKISYPAKFTGSLVVCGTQHFRTSSSTTGDENSPCLARFAEGSITPSIALREHDKNGKANTWFVMTTRHLKIS